MQKLKSVELTQAWTNQIKEDIKWHMTHLKN